VKFLILTLNMSSHADWDKHIQNLTVEELIIEALQTTEAQHKQYFLVQIAKKLGISLSHVQHDKGTPP
jgi:recombinational DNA repair protein RecR